MGVVLSGGGVSGLAHIGVLKALEENNIPIDYIAGTSAGALIAAVYACGYSIEFIDSLVRTEKFQLMSTGLIEDQYVYYFKEESPNANWIGIRFNMDSRWQQAIPTNFITPTLLDYEMMLIMAGASAYSNNNFDSLFIPFRCVSSDITNKKSVIFKSGHLNQACRASMTYPFYMKPITIDGKLMFDGGLYNNFPADVMYNEFMPDVIIGSNVSGNAKSPTEDDVLSQLKNMIVSPTTYELKCKNGIILEPDPNNEIGTFDIEKGEQAIENGYKIAMNNMDSIKTMISRRVSPEVIQAKRKAMIAKQKELIFSDISVSGLNKKQTKYVENILNRHKDTLNPIELKKRYFKLFLDENISFIFPTTLYDSISHLYSLHLEIKKEKPFKVEFGGNFSSRPINTGYIGLQYNYLGNIGIRIKANSYFGKFYSSGQVKVRFDFPINLPFYVESVITLNRLDYYRSYSTFFEDIKPSYIVLYDKYAGLNLGFPVWNKGKLQISSQYVLTRDEYYQSQNFISTDTTDKTSFNGVTAGILYERSSLNRKQYATEGAFLKITAKYFDGIETTQPGSTAPTTNRDTIVNTHKWLECKFQYDNYFLKKTRINIGIHINGTFSTKPFFSNYTATIIEAPDFSPIPESKTLFLPRFRAHNYDAVGISLIGQLTKNLELRVESYYFQPINRILEDANNQAYYGKNYLDHWAIASAAFVYHTPIGPISVSANYYDADQPLSFLIHFGYILFNNRYTD